MELHLVLELLNTLCICVFASDLVLGGEYSRYMATSKYFRAAGACLVLANLLLSQRVGDVVSAIGHTITDEVAALQSTIRLLAQRIVSGIAALVLAPAMALERMVGAHAALYIGYLMFTCITIGISVYRGVNFRRPLFWCCLAYGPVQMTAALDASTLIRYLYRLSAAGAVAAAFVIAAFFDARRFRNVSFGSFLIEVKRAVILVLPVTPFILALGSTILFLSTAVLHKLGLPQSVVDEIVRYGTLHAPLCTIYYVLKQRWVVGQYDLPS